MIYLEIQNNYKVEIIPKGGQNNDGK